MKQCKNYLTLMVPCYQYKQNRNVNIIIIKIMTMMILMMIIIIVIMISIMIMVIKMMIIIIAVIKRDSAFQPGDFSTGSTTDKGQNKSILQKFLFKASEIIRLEEDKF